MTSPKEPRRIVPPQLAERLGRVVTRHQAWTETVLGDLHEQYAALCGRRGRAFAGLWYWFQIVMLAIGEAVAAVRPSSPSRRGFITECKLAWRALLRQPLPSIAIVITLALGLGVNAGAFSMLNSIVLAPYPFPRVDRLAMIAQRSPGVSYTRGTVALPNFIDLRSANSSFESMTAFSEWDTNLTGGDQPERVRGLRVTPEFFEVFSAAPHLGRFLQSADAEAGHDHVVVLSDGLWRRAFGQRADVIGQPVRLDGETYAVVGVARPDFTFPDQRQVWAPIAMTPAAIANRDAGFTVVGRLRAETTLTKAAAAVAATGVSLVEQHPKDNANVSMVTMSFLDGMADDGTPQIVRMINIAALVVLLIGSANIASLLLARGADRRREIAVRLALGGSRFRIVRQLLVESVVLGLVAVPAALALAALVLRALRNAMPAQILIYVAGWERLGVNTDVVLFTVAGAVGAAVVFGLFPALQLSKPSIVSTLRDGGRSIAGSRARHVSRRALVVAEFALALPLIVAAGLAASGAWSVVHGPQGYDSTGVVMLRTTLSAAPYQEPAARRQFTERLVAEAERIPGVESAGTINITPSTTGGSASRVVDVEGRTFEARQRPSAGYRIASPRYFDTLRIGIQQGRGFSTADRAGSLPVAIVSASMARLLWPGKTAIGRRVKTLDDDLDTEWRTVVGVCGDIIDDWYDRRNAPMYYVPMAQRPTFTVTLVARTTGDSIAVGQALRHALTAADRNQPPEGVMTMAQSLHDRTIGLQIVSALMGGLGLLALVLATIGIYSLLAYEVSQRRHEIGVRMALGATRTAVLRLTVGHALKLAATGLAIGVAVTLPAERFVVSTLFNVVSVSPLLLVILVCVLAGTAVVASIIPARSASRLDPGLALRMS